MGANLIMIIVGLIICFGGIYFRRFCAGLMGFIWGALGALILILLMAGLRDIDEDALVGVIVAGLLFAALSAIYYKVCAVINGFSIGFTGLLIILLLTDNMDSWESVLVIALIAGLVTAVLSFKFYDYSFIILTALTGAFIASVGAFSLFKGEDFEEILFELMWWGRVDGIGMIWLGTLGLGCVGFFVQLQRLNNLLGSGTSAGGGSSQTSTATAGVVAGRFTSASGENSAYAFRPDNSASSTKTESPATNPRSLSLASYDDNDKWIVAAPIISGFVLPLISNMLYSGYYSGPFVMFTIIDWITNIAVAVTLGGLVYSTISKGPKFTAIYIAPTIAGNIILNFHYISYYGFWGLVNSILRLAVIWGILILINKAITRIAAKPLVLAISAILLHHYVINWLPGFYIYFYINAYMFVSMLATFVTVWYLYNRFHRFNIFQVSTPNVTV